MKIETNANKIKRGKARLEVLAHLRELHERLHRDCTRALSQALNVSQMMTLA